MLCELNIISLELIEALSPPPWVAPRKNTSQQLGHAVVESEAADLESPGGASKQYRVLSERWVTYALLPPPTTQDAIVPPPGIRTGCNYLLQMLVDFHRLPVPSASDPLMLRWFDEMDHPHFLPPVLHGQDVLDRMQAADLAIRSMLPLQQVRGLARMERSPVGRSDEAWVAVAYMLYGSTGGFVAQQKAIWSRDQAALRMQVWLRRGRLNIRIAERHRQRREDAARSIQKFYRGRHDGLFSTAGALANVTIEARREARRQQRLQEEREMAELREARRREARMRLLEKRRAAVLAVLPAARRFKRAHNSVANAMRTTLAKRFLARARMANATATVESSFATNAAASIWQARYRSWTVRGAIVESQLSLCAASGVAKGTQERRESLYAALHSVRASMQTLIEQATARQAKVSDASDAAELAARRTLLRASGRLVLLKECAAPVDASTIDRALDAVQRRAGRQDDDDKPSKSAGQVGAARYAELEGLTMRQRSVEDRILRLGGGASQAVVLMRSHVGAAELLLGIQEHLAHSADAWAEQAAASQRNVIQLRDLWEPIERVAASELAAVALKREIDLAVDPVSPSEALSDVSNEPPTPRRRGSLLGAGEAIPSSHLSAERFAQLLHEAELSEAAALKTYEEIASGGKREDWKAAADEAARTSGELAVVNTLAATQTAWDEHRHAITQRELRSARLASVDAKLTHQRAMLRVAYARGARSAIVTLNKAAEEAVQTARAFSIRTTLLDTVAQHAQRCVDASHALARHKEASRRAARKRPKQRANASRQVSGGGSGAVSSLLACVAAASGAGSEESEVDAVGAPATREGDANVLRTLRADVDFAKGGHAALTRLSRALPHVSERMPADWLPVHGSELLKEFAEVETTGLAEAAAVEGKLESRSHAKEALRSRTGLKGAISQIVKQGGSKGRKASGAAEGGGSAAGGGGGGGGVRYGEGAVPGRAEAERLWEERHVHTALCKAASTALATRGLGPLDASLRGSWGTIQAAVQLRVPGWLYDGRHSITSQQLVAAAQMLGLDTGPGGDWPLSWLALEVLRAPLPDGWRAIPPASPDALPTYASSSEDTSSGSREHPLLDALIEETGIMRRRLRLRWRMYRPLESHWLVASSDAVWDNGEGAAGEYVDLATGHRSPAFPSHALEPMHQGQQTTDGPGVGGGLMAVLKVAREEQRRQKRKEVLSQSIAAAELPTRAVRRAALRSQPRCGVELMHAARALRIDLTLQPELAFLAELALCVALPAGWAPLSSVAANGLPRYRNLVSGTETTTHPLEAYACEFRV